MAVSRKLIVFRTDLYMQYSIFRSKSKYFWNFIIECVRIEGMKQE